MSGTTTETGGLLQGSRFTWSGLARRLPVVLALLAVGTTLGFLGARQQPATYTATATVLVEPATGNPYAPGARGQNLANLGTEAQLVSSDAVAQLAKSSLRSSASVAALVEQLSVTNPPNSQVLEVSYTDITPTAARNGANAFANGYLVARERRAAASVQAQINNLTKARTANQSALQRALAALGKTQPGTSARVLADQRVATATAEQQKLENQISDLRLFQGDPGQVLSPATLPTGTAGLPGWIMPVAGAAVGLLLGLVLAIFRTLNDRTLRTVDDVKALGYPVLSTVRAPSGPDAVALLTDAAVDLPDGARLLRSTLGVASPDGGAVLLVPAGSAEAHTTTPLALAAALARADQTVTLLDADGELSRATHLSDADGLAEVLNDQADAETVAEQHQANLRFVPAGPRYATSVDKLASPQMRELLDKLAQQSRWLLVAGPTASAPETLTLADLCTDVVILVSLRHTTSADLQHAAEAVTRGGAKLVGVVVDEPVKRRPHRSPAAADHVATGATESAEPAQGGESGQSAGEPAGQPVAAATPKLVAVNTPTVELPIVDRAAEREPAAASDGPEQPAGPSPWFPARDSDAATAAADDDEETGYAASRRTV